MLYPGAQLPPQFRLIVGTSKSSDNLGSKLRPLNCAYPTVVPVLGCLLKVKNDATSFFGVRPSIESSNLLILFYPGVDILACSASKSRRFFLSGPGRINSSLSFQWLVSHPSMWFISQVLLPFHNAPSSFHHRYSFRQWNRWCISLPFSLFFGCSCSCPCPRHFLLFSSHCSTQYSLTIGHRSPCFSTKCYSQGILTDVLSLCGLNLETGCFQIANNSATKPNPPPSYQNNTAY